MTPRNVVLAVVLASGGSFIAGQVVQAQVDKNTVFQPMSLNNLDAVSLIYNVQTLPTYFDGGRVAIDGGVDADGGRLDAGFIQFDGGATGLWVRVVSPDVVIKSASQLLPKVPYVTPESCNTGAVVPRSSVAAVEAIIQTTVLPSLAQQCSIALADAGAGP